MGLATLAPFVSLFLRQPPPSADTTPANLNREEANDDQMKDEEITEGRQKVLGVITTSLRRLLLSDKSLRKEIITWLGTTISVFHIDPDLKLSLFIRPLASREAHSPVSDYTKRFGSLNAFVSCINSDLILSSSYAATLMLMLCQHRAKEVWQLVRDDLSLIKAFFRGESGDDDRHSSSSSGGSSSSSKRIDRWFNHFSYSEAPKRGAKALEQYCLANRETLWDRLTWEKGMASPFPLPTTCYTYSHHYTFV